MTESGLPSTFVPGRNLVFFVYAAALDSGFSPATIIIDAPVVYDDPGL